jgi:hypothetical protein
MSLKNSSNPNNLKHEYIYGSIHKNGRRSFRSLDNLIKEYELAASTVYRYSSKEQWKDQRIAFRAELSEEIKKARKHDIFVSLTISKMDMDIEFYDLSLRDNEDFYKNGVLFFGAVNYLTQDRFNRVLGRYSLRFGTAV